MSALPGRPSHRDPRFVTTDSNKLYDFLYALDYDAWFCNLIKAQRDALTSRPLKDFILKLHTGESLAAASSSWSWEERAKLGQRYIRDLAEDILQGWETQVNAFFKDAAAEKAEALLRQLELDGHILQNGRLLAPERDVINVEQEAGLLTGLYTDLELDDPKTAFHHLDQSEARYIEGNWDDSISNSRKYLESVIRAVASAHHMATRSAPLADATKESPAECRKYLHECGLIEKKELDAIAKVYGLLSHTGAHPYMAEQDQARLMRHLALTFCQFVLVRFRGFRKAA